MAPDEIQAAIDRAEAKRKEIADAQPQTRATAKVLSILPKAAALYSKQIAEGLDGDPRAALKARIILRDLFGGKIRLVPGAQGSLWAEYELHPAALLKGSAVGAGTCGSGGRI
jgi:site-specific DNA recombinase